MKINKLKELQLDKLPKEIEVKPLKPSYCIVGIGASAGGLEALELFLSKVPETSGMAYVVIQHLDPTQKGMLPELLQRITTLKVYLVKDRMTVKVNCIYVIPPNRSMSILNGKLYLFEPLEARGLRLPIDFFFHSLADDLRDQSVGVILSGMGSDGSVGLKAIKDKNGVTLVQSPETARFDSMPRSAIETVQTDIVAPPEELFIKFQDFLHRRPVVSSIPSGVDDPSALEKIIILLRTFTGNDFSMYKKNTMYRRIERRMGVHKIDKISSYVHFFQDNPKEADILFKELLIGVTNFFRDELVWKHLKEVTLPGLIRNHNRGLVLRAWVTGCSTGEEAYSLAIVFKEALEAIKPKVDISLSIFATDLDNDAIEKARKGIYSSTIEEHVSTVRLKRFFTKNEGEYRINSEIRELVVFAQHNVTLHPPFTKIDFLSCRNLLIYMNADLQRKLLGLFYFSMNPNAILLLGSSETIGSQSHFFSTVDAKLKLYKRSENSLTLDLSDLPTTFTAPNKLYTENTMPSQSPQNIQALADQLLLQQFSPIGVLVTENGDIIYTSGRTGKYLEPAVGKANLNIFAMLREGLRHEFPVIFRKVVAKKSSEVLHHLKVGVKDAQTINLHVHWIDAPGLLKGTVMIIFKDVATEENLSTQKKSGRKGVQQSELENELLRSREEMQGILEDMQTSQEELKSTNEELQSTNEELQSTNEELTSSKEEMQSLNEELQTLNAELQSKVDDYSRVNNDMKNLLNSTDIATLFLDKQMNIRRFTPQATHIFKLIKSDIGRRFTDQASDLVYPELVQDAHQVLKSLVFIEKQIPTRDHRWFSIRIMPYRTFDDRIDGLVITFINITDLKQLELQQQYTEKIHRLFLDATTDVFLNLSAGEEITGFSTSAEKFFGVKKEDVLQQNFFDQFVPEAHRSKCRKLIRGILKKNEPGHIDLTLTTAEKIDLKVKCMVHTLINGAHVPETILMIVNQDDHDKR